MNKKTLDFWRETGYLKPGTHWRSSFEAEQIPWNPKVIYNIKLCWELIEYTKENDATAKHLAA